MKSEALSRIQKSGPLVRALRGILMACAFVLAFLSVPTDASAENLIKRPGAHNRYAFEIEPQLVYRYSTPYNNGYYGWNGGYYGYNTDGIGAGVRVNIPFMHNGPIDQINNNIGISFGGAFTWHGTPGPDAVVLNIPVAFQWNFYFTDIISVLGEAGFNTPLTFWDGRTRFNVEPLFQGGGRFQFGKVGVIVRVGYPMASVGANFQF